MTDQKNLLHCFKCSSKTAMWIIAHEKFNFPTTTIQPGNFDLSLYKIISLHKKIIFFNLKKILLYFLAYVIFVICREVKKKISFLKQKTKVTWHLTNPAINYFISLDFILCTFIQNSIQKWGLCKHSLEHLHVKKVWNHEFSLNKVLYYDSLLLKLLF